MASTIGRLFVFEGPDGVGKTALAGLFAERLRESGADCYLTSFPGREPGTLGHLVYELHHEAARLGVPSLVPTSLQMLHVAAHIDAIEQRIVPALMSGRDVILDRFWWSTWVYGLVTDANRRAIRAMLRAERACWGATQPAAAFLIMRAAPLREADTGGGRDALCAAYRELAVSEARWHPVHVVRNDGAIHDTLREVVRLAGMEEGC